MATIKLEIRSAAKDRRVPIYLRFTSGQDIVLRVKTGLEVYAEHWSNPKGKLQPNPPLNEMYTREDHTILENKLVLLKTFIETETNSLTSKGGIVTYGWLETLLAKFHNPDKKTDKQETLNEYFSRFIVEIESGERLTDSMKYRAGTVKSFKGTLVQFNLYQGRKRLNFDAITMDFYNDFIRYCNRKNYSQNTTGKHIKHLKTIMRSAREEGLHQNNEIDRKAFRVLRVEVQNIYLNGKEIQQLTELDLADNPIHGEARDIFLIGYYTVQRFSDYSRINPDMIRTMNNGIKVLELIQEKTGEQVIIPIHPELDRLLKKYNYSLPKAYEQKVNKRIKEVAALADITEPVQIEQSKGGMIKKTTITKDKLIMTHTARRSGCTNMYLAGVPTLDIMKISGHKTENEFLKYIKVTKEETATNLARHPYYNPPLLKIAK